MTRYPSLSADDKLDALWRRFPRAVRPIIEMHDAVMRDEGPLDVAIRELIAAYVSSLNACSFCYGAHALMAEAFGVDRNLIETLVNEGPDKAPVDDSLKPLLAFVRQLTLEPSKMTDAHAQAVYDAGWDEEALYLTSQVTACYAFMNRILDGAGITPRPVFSQPGEEDLEERRQGTYMTWAKASGIL